MQGDGHHGNVADKALKPGWRLIKTAADGSLWDSDGTPM